MRRTLVIGLMLPWLFALTDAGRRQPSNDFQLSLERKYGRAIFSECRLDVVSFAARATVSLHCAYAARDGKGKPIQPLIAREEWPQAEVRRFGDLVQRSALFDGGHIGTDSTASDGVFETIEMRSNGRAVVLVTSGNETFVKTPARRELLTLLQAVEKRLADQGRSQ